MGADIAEIVAAQREKAAVGVERELGRDGEIAAHIVGDECLGAFAGPFDRPSDAARRPDHQREFRKEAVAGAEIAADLAGDDADIVERHAENRRDFLLLPHDAAGAGIQRVASACRIVDADGGARLHRHAGDAIDPGVEPRHVRRASERRVGRLGVADLGVDHDIGQIVVEPRRIRRDRGLGVGHRRQRLVIDQRLFRRRPWPRAIVSATTKATAVPTWRTRSVAST